MYEVRDVKCEKEGTSETVIGILYPVRWLVFLKLFASLQVFRIFSCKGNLKSLSQSNLNNLKYCTQ